MCTRLLPSTDSTKLDMENNIACVITGAVIFMLVSFSIMFFLLVIWYRSQHTNPQSSTNTCHSEQQPQCIIPIIVYETQASPTMCKYDNNECSICLAEFEDGERLRVLPNCKHVFHVACIDQWIPPRSLNCPVCRDRTIHHDIEPVRTGCANNNSSSSMFGVVNFGMNRL